MMMTIQMLMRAAAGTRGSLATLVVRRTIARAAKEARRTGLEAEGQAAALVPQVARLGARTAAARIQSISFISGTRVTATHFRLAEESRAQSGASSWEHVTTNNW